LPIVTRLQVGLWQIGTHSTAHSIMRQG
jgi:hypothetical protein